MRFRTLAEKVALTKWWPTHPCRFRGGRMEFGEHPRNEANKKRSYDDVRGILSTTTLSIRWEGKRGTH